jgi:DNA-directed RNA polymerase beta subunit
MPIDDDNKELLDKLTYRYDDTKLIRNNIGNKLVKAIEKSFPLEWGGVKLVVKNVKWDPKEFSLADQKKALLNEEFLSTPLKADLELFDSNSGELLDHIENKTLLKVPYYTERGNFIHGGNEYATLRQLRLRPGIYNRRKLNGELETQFNIERGTGTGFRISFNPTTALYKLNVGQSSSNLYSILHDIGVSDEELVDAWGPDIFVKNKAKYNSKDLEKVYNKLVKNKPKTSINRDEMSKLVKESFDLQQVDKDIKQLNLGLD